MPTAVARPGKVIIVLFPTMHLVAAVTKLHAAANARESRFDGLVGVTVQHENVYIASRTSPRLQMKHSIR